MKIDRRQFLILSGAAVLEAQQLLKAQPNAPTAQGPVPWHQKLKRVGQINFNERDPIELDVNAWADYWADLKVDAVLVSVTGIVAFYPTDVPFHRKTPFLNNRDFFGDCCNAAKKRGLHVIARMSPDLQWDEATKVHPEWFRRDAAGKFVESDQVPGLFNTCPFTTYFTEHIPAIMREINARYEVDGIFTNAWPPLPADLPVCYCDQCKGKAEPGSAAFFERHNQRTIELWKLYTAIAHEKNPNNIYFGNLGGGTRALIDLHALGEQCFWFNCDNQGRGGDDTPAWACAQQGRAARAIMKGKPITNVTGAWSTGKVKWRNVAKNKPEADLWMAQTTASGMRIWYHWLGGQTGMGEDHRWQAAGRDFFHWMAKYDEHFTYNRSIANLGVVWSQRCNALYKPPAPGATGYSEYVQGLYAALLEGRFFFDFVHEDDLSAENLKKYSALLLPNVALLSDSQCKQLTDYVNDGGSLLATFETGLYEETGKRRNEFALGDLFGLSRAGEIQGPKGNSSYARIEQSHEILSGFSDTHILPGAEYRLPVKMIGSTQPILTVIPAYTAYPPERSYSPTPHTSEPAVVISEKNRSRLIWFPGDIERTAWRSGNTDVSQLLQNSIRWLLRGASPVTVEGDGIAEMFAWETDPGFALHIVNYTNPNLHKGWFRRHYPIGAQKVRMEIPGGTKIARVQLLRAEQDIPFQQSNDHVEFTIPKVVDYEVAALIRE
jgi:hypothetical protein